jgi:Zn-dependent M28 family amino/carboxypeptidase
VLRRRLVWLALGLAGCVAQPLPPPVAEPAPPPAPPPTVSAAPPPGPALDASIAAAVRRVDRDQLLVELLALTAGRRASEAELRVMALHLQAELRRYGYGAVLAPLSRGSVPAANVIADRAGDDPSRVVVVCAHYDAVPGSPGADDNGSGVAAVLAVAQAVAAAPTHASVRFIAFALEEEGLLGSGEYVASLSREERGRIAAVLNLEMVGFRAAGPGSQSMPPGVDLFADEPLPTTGDFIGALGLRGEPELLDALRAARAYVPELPVAFLAVPRAAVLLMPDLLRSDHAPFWLTGTPAVMITDTANFRNPNYHRRTDAFETVDLDFATSVARWVTAGTLLLASPRGAIASGLRPTVKEGPR